MRRAILLTAALASALLLIILGAAPARAQSVQLVPFGGQTYASPYYVTGEPGNPGRVYVVEGAGTIRLVEDGATKSPAFLDISGEVCFSGEATCGPESGMVSMARTCHWFSPAISSTICFSRSETVGPSGVLRRSRTLRRYLVAHTT